MTIDAGPFEVTPTRCTMHARLCCPGELEVGVTANAIPALVGIAHAAGCRRLHLHLASIESAPTAILAALVIAFGTARRCRVELLIEASSALHAAASIARLERVLAIRPDA